MNLDGLARFLAAKAELLTLVSAISLFTLVASVALVPWLVVRAPRDLFVRERAPVVDRHPALALVLGVLRNLLGGLLLVAGLLMLVLPGQGVLTMVAGLCLLDVPRKRELIRHFVSRPAVWRGLSWLRARGGKPPFDRP